MEKNKAVKKNDNCTVVNFVLLYFIGRGCNLVSGNVYGRVQSARSVGECFQKLVSDPDK